MSGAAALLVLMTLTYVTVGTGVEAEGFDFVRQEGATRKRDDAAIGTLFFSAVLLWDQTGQLVG